MKVFGKIIKAGDRYRLPSIHIVSLLLATRHSLLSDSSDEIELFKLCALCYSNFSYCLFVKLQPIYFLSLPLFIPFQLQTVCSLAAVSALTLAVAMTNAMTKESFVGAYYADLG
jgi:hypothetical protein